MDELHAAIAAHLCTQRRQLAETGELAERILAIWYERAGVPHCRYCGRPIIEGDDAFDVEQMRAARACVEQMRAARACVEQMRAARACVEHYAPF